MIFDKYGCDIDKLQKKDNENYQRKYTKEKGPISPNVPKGPKDISTYLKTRKPTEWIVDSFGASGACVIIAGDKGSGKTSFIYRLAESISKGEKFLSELYTVKKKVLIWQADESKINALNKLNRMDINEGIDIVYKDYGWNQLNIHKLGEQIEINNYGVVLIDSISTLVSNRGVNFKDMEIATPLYELNNLAGELNILIVITSHLNKEDRDDFKSYVNSNTSYNEGNMFVSNSKNLMKQYYETVFPWLRNCENIFGFNLKGYAKIRIYAFLAERFLPYWFNKNGKVLEWKDEPHKRHI